MECIFCEIIAGRKEAHVIYEDNAYIAIMDRYPIQVGHSLVMPRDHHERIIDMPAESVSSLFAKVPLVAKAVLQATGADGFHIGQNNGKAANQIIPHVHVHIIPRYEKMGNPWKKRTIASDEDLKKLSYKIKDFIKSD